MKRCHGLLSLELDWRWWGLGLEVSFQRKGVYLQLGPVSVDLEAMEYPSTQRRPRERPLDTYDAPPASCAEGDCTCDKACACFASEVLTYRDGPQSLTQDTWKA